jgi:hypothetical protein
MKSSVPMLYDRIACGIRAESPQVRPRMNPILPDAILANLLQQPYNR